MNRLPSGRFAPGVSGNPNGRPTTRQDSTAMTVVRRDGYTNAATGQGTSRDRRTLTRFRGTVVTDVEGLELWRSEFLAKRIVEAKPEEAMKRGWVLHCEDKEACSRVAEAWDDLDGDENLTHAAQVARACGGSAIFPIIEGAQGSLSEPLDDGAIGAITALHVFEPRELLPIDYYRELGPKWGRPSLYGLYPVANGRVTYLGGEPIHETRLIILPGRKITRQTMWGQRESWGDSCLTPVAEVLADFGTSWGAAATLLQHHGKETLQMEGLADMLAQADGLDEFDRHISAMYQAWSALRMNVIDGKSQISRSTGTLAGVHELLAEFKELVAAAGETPMSQIFGTAGKGLRTGDDDLLSWYSTCERWRTKTLRKPHRGLVRLLMLSSEGPTNGAEPEGWSVKYPPMHVPSDKEVAETRLTDMERAKIATETGIASADDVAESFFGGETYSPDIRINWERRKAQADLDAAQAEQDPEAVDALGGEGGEPELDDDELDAMALEDEEDVTLDDEEGDDAEEEDRTDSAGRPGAGHDVARAPDGRFGHVAGQHNGPKRAAGSGGGRAAAPKFNAEPHKAAIAAHKATEAQHRKESLRIKAEMVAVRDGAKGAPKAERAKAKAKLDELRAQRDQHQAKANEARTARIAASKGMASARAEHTAAARATRENAKAEKEAAKAAKQTKVKPAENATSKPAEKPAAKKEPDPRATHEAAAKEALRKAHEAHAASLEASKSVLDHITDADVAGARQHLAKAEAHHAEMLGHLAAAREHATAHGGKDLADHIAAGRELSQRDQAVTGYRTIDELSERGIGKASAHLRFASQDLQERGALTQKAPEAGALKAGDYRKMSEAYPDKLSRDQKLAIMNYSDHSDRILNPALRKSEGRPDPTTKLYEGSHAPAHVHKDRLGKRRERISARDDHDMTVGTEIKHLDAAIAAHKMDRDVLTYRVLGDPDGKITGSLKVGSIMKDHGYVSTTADKGLLNRFYDGDQRHRVDIHVTVKKGTSVAPMAELSSFRTEREMLLARGSSFRVTKVIEAKGKQAKQIHVETI